MSDPASTYQLFVGVDIAAQTAAIAWHGRQQTRQRPFTIEQTPAGFAQLQAKLQTTMIAPAATLVVMEATGSYWMQLASFLHAAGYRVSVINPKQARDFARATLRHAKSDALDAELLADLARQLQPPVWNPPPQIYHELEQRLTQRDSLIGLRQQLRNQLHALRHEQVVIASVVRRQEELIGQLDQEIKTLAGEIEELTGQEDAWAKSIVLLRTIPGVGLITAAWVVVATANFTACADAAAASSYAGLAPYVYQSGTSVRGRPQVGWTGKRVLRHVLYMAAVTAIRCHPQLKLFYARLRTAGKAAKLALCAVARKLLHLIWAVGTKQQAYDPRYGVAAAAQALAAQAEAA
jgi:transposase